MMALSKKMLEREPGEIELLLPWYAAGTLNPRDTRRVEEALAGDPELAKQYAAIRGEYEETIHLNESLGAPSARAMQKLFAAIDAEPARATRSLPLPARIATFFASLSPRTLAWSATLGAIALLLQAGIIGAVLMQTQPATFQTASLSTGAPVMRELGAATPSRALVRFTPEARVADITALLDNYQASIIGDAKGGMFRLQFDKAMSQDELTALLARMQREKFVNLAVAAP
ncbi:anti-sigma factor RsiW [Bradyrhizobium sp. USDA 4472]